MLIALNNYEHNYEIEQLTRMFTRDTEVVFCQIRDKKTTEDFLYLRQNQTRVFICLYYNKVLYKEFLPYLPQKEKNIAQICKIAYTFYTKAFGKTLAWGTLTGVRPVGYMRKLGLNGETLPQVKQKFKDEYLVSEEKIKLCEDIFTLQKPIVEAIKPNDYSLYISIPFCPSRCSYCSFISTPTKNADKLMSAYVVKLCEELEYTAKLCQKAGRNLKTVYIGGGTPTAVSNAQLEDIMATISRNFDLSKVLEYTVEAGRPDCTSRQKLETIKRYGAHRVSINPQTFSNDVLCAIGRKHSHQDFLNCYKEARDVGFRSINTDLIAGLPNDTVESFERSLQGCIDLKAENITVHTLTLKRASSLNTNAQQYRYCDVSQMLAKNKLLLEHGYLPYYMYRQKATLQSLENVGFSQPYHESLYNIYIMEEIGTIISCGAGAVSKIIGTQGEIKRVYNYKHPTEYVSDFSQILNRKDEVYNLWQQFGFQND